MPGARCRRAASDPTCMTPHDSALGGSDVWTVFLFMKSCQAPITGPRVRGPRLLLYFVSHLGGWLEWAQDAGSKKGHPMALDPTTFLIVFSAALVVMGLVIWLRFHLANKKQPD